MGYLCTCARADRASVSQERLGRLGSILVVSWGSWTRCLTQVIGGISLHVRTCRPHFCISGSAWPIVFKFDMWVGGHYVRAFHKSWVGWGISAHAHLCTCALAPPPPLPPYLRIWLTNFAKLWCVNRDPMVTRFTKVGGGETVHSHVRLQFRYLGNRSALTLKPHQKQTFSSLSGSLFRARSFIAKHGVLLVHYFGITFDSRISFDRLRPF